MKDYTAEFRKKGDTGTQVASSDNLSELFDKMKKRGFVVKKSHINEVLEWDKIKEKGTYYGLRFQIRKGELEMTEYSSL